MMVSPLREQPGSFVRSVVMRSLCTKFLAAALVALLAIPAFAQDERPNRQPGQRSGQRPGRGGPGMRGGQFLQGPMLLRLKSVREELNLTSEQSDQLRKKAEEVRDKYRDQLQQARTGGDPQEAQKVFRAMAEEANKAVHEVLKPEQAKRFRQIQLQLRLQMAGPYALLDRDVERQLNLSDKQKEDLKECADELNKDRQELFRDARGNPEQMPAAFKKAQQLTQKARDKAVSELTGEQREKWQQLTGKKFQIPPEEIRQLFQGGPGGRRGPGEPRGDRPPRPQPRDE